MNLDLILVTGASGFIGRHLCAHLLGKSLKVRGTVRVPERTAALPAGVEAAVVGPLGPDTDWRSALKGVTAVVHLAGRTHILREARRGIGDDLHRANGLGTRSLVEQALEVGVRRLIYMSSLAVLDPTVGSVINEGTPVGPRTRYGWSKLQGEAAVAEGQKRGLPCTILRPTTVYGPGDPGNVFRLISALDQGVPLPAPPPEVRRSFLYVGNLVSAVERTLIDARAIGETFLVSDEAISVQELAIRIAVLLGRRARLIPLPAFGLYAAGAVGNWLGRLMGVPSLGDRVVRPFVVDGGRLQRVLDWVPPFAGDEGLGETVSWYLARRRT